MRGDLTVMMSIEERKNSEAARFHIEMMQGIINRMASNSSNCKSWCIAVITAIFALYASKEDCPQALIIVCIVPTFLFFCTDSYYLGLERMFRNFQSSFYAKINDPDSDDWLKEIFRVSSAANETKSYPKIFISSLKVLADGMMSVSTAGFYGLVVVMIIAVWSVLN